MSSRNQTKSESLVIDCLRKQLLPGEQIFHHVRFSDAQHGDVEADVLVMVPGSGIAVIEIKGGVVQYSDGQWLMVDDEFQRRIKPIDQARNAKHALRKYLDRQLEWKHGLIRSEWFLALPYTDVTSDMGPEGRRELLIGKNDLKSAMTQIRTALNSSEITDPRPTTEMINAAVELLVRPGVVAENQSKSLRSWLTTKPAIALAIGLLVIAGAGVGIWRAGAGEPPVPNCSSNYSGCVPIGKDVDCSDLSTSVTVTGVDIYKLDQDGDGKACEWNPAPQGPTP